MNDICFVCKHSTNTAILFADVTNLFVSGRDIKTLENNINSELLNISISLKVNKLSLNIKKTHYMIFYRRKKFDANVELSTDEDAIDEVLKTNFLGVVIDENKRVFR